MALKTSPFDVADYLIDENEIFHYLDAELETDEPQYLAEALSAAVRARGGIDRVAAESGGTVDSLANAGALDHVSVQELTIQVMEGYRLRMSSDSQVA
jgi:probable addiction module antidote protein